MIGDDTTILEGATQNQVTGDPLSCATGVEKEITPLAVRAIGTELHVAPYGEQMCPSPLIMIN